MVKGPIDKFAKRKWTKFKIPPTRVVHAKSRTLSIPMLPSLSFLADRCRSLRQISQVHAQMLVTAGIPSDNYAASRLLLFYSHNPNYHHHALSLLSSTPSPNSFFFNTLIRTSPPPLSFSLFSLMLRSAVSPGKHTFPFLLKAATALRSHVATMQTHTHCLRRGLCLDEYVANALIHAYSCCGRLVDSRQVFDELPTEERNAMIWTTMISGYVKNSLPSEGIVLFEEMVGLAIEPCGATLATVLSACARTGALEMGRRVHGMIDAEVGIILGTALVDMYAKNGAILEAKKVFVGMAERNTATWNAMICGLAHHGYPDKAIEMFWWLKTEKEVQPNDITFTGALAACCHAGWVDLGREIFHSISGKYRIEPKVEHYGCMVDLLGRSGRLEEAKELVTGMKCKADLVVWGALLTACRNYGKIAIAEMVVQEMLKLDPDNHSVYVVLSNMYAEVGRWEDVERLRSAMRDEGLKKIPGWSCVDGHG